MFVFFVVCFCKFEGFHQAFVTELRGCNRGNGFKKQIQSFCTTIYCRIEMADIQGPHDQDKSSVRVVVVPVWAHVNNAASSMSLSVTLTFTELLKGLPHLYLCACPRAPAALHINWHDWLVPDQIRTARCSAEYNPTNPQVACWGAGKGPDGRQQHGERRNKRW